MLILLVHFLQAEDYLSIVYVLTYLFLTITLIR